MGTIKKTAVAIAIAAGLASLGCSTQTTDTATQAQQTDMTASVAPIVLTDAAFLAAAANEHSRYTVEAESVLVEFDEVSQADANSKWPNMKFRPVDGSADWNTKGGLKLTLENPNDSPLRVELKVADSIGIMGAATHQLDKPIELAAGETKTVDYLFNGSEMGMDGYRGGEELDLKTISEFQFYVVGPAHKQSLRLHDIAFIERTGDFVKSQAREDVIASATVPTVLSLSQFDDPDSSILELKLGTDVTRVENNGGHALRVQYSTDEAYPTVKFSAGTQGESWDWTQYGDVALAFDAKNLGDKGVQLFVRVDDDLDEKLGGGATGVVHSRSGYVQLPPQSKDTYYFTLKDLAEAMNSGMRGEPPKQAFSATQVVFGWGETELDLSNIVSFQLYMMNPLADAELEFDNLRLIPNLTNDTSRYSNIIDEFGQYTAEQWPEKVTDLADLQSRAAQDYALLEEAALLPDRSTYGGWSDGPKLNATGYFRTEKVNGKWALVDPDGYLYFATGLDNIRMDDSYTTTGIGFSDITDVATDDLRPSQVAESGYLESTQPRAQLSPLRRGMFTELPDYDSELAQNYNYTQMIHTGPLKHGEVFSFYGANLQRKYQQSSQADALAIWQDVTLARMMDWGFTSLGNWSDPSFYGNGKVPYTAHGWIVGSHQRINTGNDYWGPMHDPFDPEFRRSVATMAKSVADDVDNDPFCIGYFVDNELSWGNTQFDASHYALALSGLKASSQQSSAKKAFDDILQQQYGSIEKLNAAWSTSFESWESFAQGVSLPSDLSEAMKQDLSVLLSALADQFFRVVDEEMQNVLPNHLNLGSRFSDWGITPEAANAAAKYVDVMSYNLYAKDLNSKGDWSHLPELDMPSIIGEFHFGATDSGLFHPGLVSMDNQQGRADAYAHYMRSVIDNPYFVGAHWFQYMDSPATGRAWDGENYNVGFVTVTDTPYKPLVESARKVNQELYTRRFGQ